MIFLNAAKEALFSFFSGGHSKKTEGQTDYLSPKGIVTGAF